MDSTTKMIKRQAKDVVIRIVLFIFVYLLLVALGAILIGLSIRLAVWIFPFIFVVKSAQIMAILALILVGGVGFTLMFGLYLIKFLFSRTKIDNSRRRQVTEKECPALFQAITEVAKATDSPMPKKVFLSPDVNACVFYDTNFWSIFFPVRKNLEIGLGLFICTNVDELKSILAHEFGHFSQKSMKVGSGVYVANQVIYNLTYTEDGWDRFVEKWCRADVSLLAFFGVLTRRFTNVIRKILHKMYHFVNKSYMKLSRSMEYDADAIACNYMGKEVFASALRKIEYLSFTDNEAKKIISIWAQEGKKADNVFDIHDAVTQILAKNDNIHFKHESLVTTKIDFGYPESRIKTENVWDTHPSMDDRIAFASGAVTRGADYRASWELLPIELIKEISAIIQDEIQDESVEITETLSGDVLVEKCRECHQKIYIPHPYSAFLCRHLFIPDEQEITSYECVNPFTTENLELVKEYVIALGDARTLQAIQEKEMEVEKLYYQGEEYSLKKLPIDKHATYLNTLSENVKSIDKDIYKYAILHAATGEEKENIRFLFQAISFSANYKELYYNDIYNRVNILMYHLNRGVALTEEEAKSLKQFIIELETLTQKMMNEGNWDMIAYATEPESGILKQLQDFAQKENLTSQENVLEVNYINEILNNSHIYLNLLDELDWKAKSKLADFFKKLSSNSK